MVAVFFGGGRVVYICSSGHPGLLCAHMQFANTAISCGIVVLKGQPRSVDQ